MTKNKICYVVVDGHHENDGHVDGRIRVFSTLQKAKEFIKKHQEEIKKGGRPGDQFSGHYNDETVMEIEME